MKKVLLKSLVGLFLILNLHANSYPFKPLKVPKAEDIVAFSNGQLPGAGVTPHKKKEDILKILQEGKNNTDLSTWTVAALCGSSNQSNGVITDKENNVFFWRWIDDKTLRLDNDAGECALIELK